MRRNLGPLNKISLGLLSSDFASDKRLPVTSLGHIFRNVQWMCIIGATYPVCQTNRLGIMLLKARLLVQ